MKNSRSLVVGVTGGIGSGKSEVCRIFRSLGAYVISADDLAKQLMETNASLKRDITMSFGDDAYTAGGKLNRRKLADEIFSDHQKKAALDSIVHPYVLRGLRDLIREKSASYRIIVIEAALIYEAGAERLMDVVVVVDADREKRFRRVMQRDGVSRADVLRRANAQMSQREKTRRADFVVLNNDDLASLRSKVSFLYKLFLTMSRS
jgi:dephospho-CoA kinase